MAKSNLPGTRTVITSDGFGLQQSPLRVGTKPVKSSASAKPVGSLGPNTEPNAPLKPFLSHPPAGYTGAVQQP